MKKVSVILLLLAIAIAPVVYIYYRAELLPNYIPFNALPKSSGLEAGNQYNVLSVKVLDGYRFQLRLDGDNWVECHLVTASKEEATSFVEDLLTKTGASPIVDLRRKVDNFWIVDLYLIKDGKGESLLGLLKTSNLLLE